MNLKNFFDSIYKNYIIIYFKFYVTCIFQDICHKKFIFKIKKIINMVINNHMIINIMKNL